MRSEYEAVSNDLDDLYTAYYDGMRHYSTDTKIYAIATKKRKFHEDKEALDQLAEEMFAGHGWTRAEWEAENDRRVNAYLNSLT